MRFDVELLLLIVSPLFLLIIGAEFYYWRRQQAGVYRLADTLCNAALALMHQAADQVAWLVTLPLFAWLYQEHALFKIEPGWVSVLALFVLQDFCYYCFHRASHRIRWFWAAHSVHHSSTHMNFSTAFRQSLMYPVAGMWLFWLPLAWIGFAPQAIIAVVLINLAFQFFVHTRLSARLPWLEWLINTPSVHRCHHAKNPRYIDSNYAGVLTIWDHLFGSFVAEAEDEPCEYGTVKPVNSFNPIKVTFDEWLAIGREWRQVKAWSLRLGLLFAAPERAAEIVAQAEHNTALARQPD